MPVRKLQNPFGALRWLICGVTGPYQILSDRCERERTDIEWQACRRHLAGHLVFRISEHETEEEDPSYDTRGEDVKAVGLEK